MKYLLALTLMLLMLGLAAQPAQNLISAVKKAQSSITAVSYTLLRSDSFVTGQTRIIHGEARLKPLVNDTIFGFAFWGKRNDLSSFSVYDGKMGYNADESTKRYIISTGQGIPHMLGAPGGQVIFEDLLMIDTAGAIRFALKEDARYYFLTIVYPDIKEYDVDQRYKFLTIDKNLMIPVSMRKYQETLGKVQHLKYEASDIRLDDKAYSYNFFSPAFLDNYSQEVPVANKALSALKDKLIPEFSLFSFAGEKINTNTFSGKVVLLDFWEVWCGPCIASMPKVDALYERYKDKGLQVYGVTNETNQLESARKLVIKKEVRFPNLIGNKNIERAFRITGVPLYILIDKQGIVKFISQGFSEKIEEEIRHALNFSST